MHFQKQQNNIVLAASFSIFLFHPNLSKSYVGYLHLVEASIRISKKLWLESLYIGVTHSAGRCHLQINIQAIRYNIIYKPYKNFMRYFSDKHKMSDTEYFFKGKLCKSCISNITNHQPDNMMILKI